MAKLLYIVNESYFFMSHRLPIARAARAAGYQVHVAAPEDHVWAPEGFTVQALSDAGFAFHPIPLSRRGTNPWQEVRTLIALWRLMRGLRPELVHLLTIKPLLYGGLAARLLGVPGVVAAVTGLGQVFVSTGAGAGLLRRLAVMAYRIATGHPNGRVIVQNAGDMETLARSGAVKPERMVLIRGSGVSLSAFAPSPEPAGPPLVILPARMIWEKGVAEFVAAARLLRARGVEARFALIGDSKASNPRAVPEPTLEKWSREGGVEWWGRRTDMARVFAGAHVVCLPSTYGEGVPKVLIEAAACGRPIVASDIPGCREITREGENGLLVPPGDVEVLAAALARLIEDPALRRRMGDRGRELVEAGFSEDRVVTATLEVYRALLAGR